MKHLLAMVKELKGKIADVKDVDVLICPTFTAISALANEAKGTNISPVGIHDAAGHESRCLCCGK